VISDADARRNEGRFALYITEERYILDEEMCRTENAQLGNFICEEEHVCSYRSSSRDIRGVDMQNECNVNDGPECEDGDIY
jgi:hypothetical protein